MVGLVNETNESMLSASMLAAIRRFALRTSPTSEAIRYTTLPDERHDISLAAYRIYGDRSLFMVVLAAAGLDSVEQVMLEQDLVLPTLSQLADLRNGLAEGQAW